MPLKKDIQNELLSMCIWDRPWLRACGELVSQDDFKPLAGRATLAWLVSGIALDFYKKNREPLGALVHLEMERWTSKSRMSENKKEELTQFIKKLKKLYDPARSELYQKEVINWKKERNRRRALNALIDHEHRGTLTDDVWLATTQEVSATLPESGFEFQTAAELAEDEESELKVFAFPGLAAAAICLITGKIKISGKTTYVLAQCRALIDGLPFLGHPTIKTRVVYLTEQPKPSFKLALKRAGLLGSKRLTFLSFNQTRGKPWGEVVRAAVEECRRQKAHVLVVDTLSQFAGLKADEENQTGAALRAMEPLQTAAIAQGLAVEVVLHERKAGGNLVDSGRGSSAYGGAVDTILNLSRPLGNHPNNLRVLQGITRLEDVPEQLMIELTDSGEYVVKGTSLAVAEDAAREAILKTLPKKKSESLSLEQICEQTKTTRQTAQRVLKTLRGQGTIQRSGTGTRGDCHRYFIAAQNADPKGKVLGTNNIQSEETTNSGCNSNPAQKITPILGRSISPGTTPRKTATDGNLQTRSKTTVSGERKREWRPEAAKRRQELLLELE